MSEPKTKTHALVREKHPIFQEKETEIIDLQLIKPIKGQIEEKKIHFSKIKIEDSNYSRIVLVGNTGSRFFIYNLFLPTPLLHIFFYSNYFSAKEEMEKGRFRAPALTKSDSTLAEMINQIKTGDMISHATKSIAESIESDEDHDDDLDKDYEPLDKRSYSDVDEEIGAKVIDKNYN